jgi:hypothetical protein
MQLLARAYGPMQASANALTNRWATSIASIVFSRKRRVSVENIYELTVRFRSANRCQTKNSLC